MRYWEMVCSERLGIANGRLADPPSFERTLATAYEAIVKPFLADDIIAQTAFELAIKAAPPWDEIREKLVAVNGTEADFSADAKSFIPTISQFATRLEDLLKDTYPQYETVGPKHGDNVVG